MQTKNWWTKKPQKKDRSFTIVLEQRVFFFWLFLLFFCFGGILCVANLNDISVFFRGWSLQSSFLASGPDFRCQVEGLNGTGLFQSSTLRERPPGGFWFFLVRGIPIETNIVFIVIDYKPSLSHDCILERVSIQLQLSKTWSIHLAFVNKVNDESVSPQVKRVIGQLLRGLQQLQFIAYNPVDI